jgi:hypothetical protein
METPPSALSIVQEIIEDLNRFGRMSIEELKRHWEEHPEDRMQSLQIPGGRGRRGMSRRAARLFSDLAEQLRKRSKDGHALGQETLDSALRHAFGELFYVEGRLVDEESVGEMMSRAVKESRTHLEAVTHYLPCVLVTPATPQEFKIGPVHFLTGEKFFSDYLTAIESDYRAENQRHRKEHARLIAAGKGPSSPALTPYRSAEIEKEMLDSTCRYYRQFPWVAEVEVPPCDEKVSARRARDAAQGAMDLLKPFFEAQGSHFRLAEDPSPTVSTDNLTRRKGEFQFSWSRGGEGAFVEEGWWDELSQARDWIVRIGGAAIEGYVNPAIESTLRDRWLDALDWYGQAISERRLAARLVKFAAALERLTVTENKPGVTDLVTRRTALLAADDPVNATTIARAREDANEIYRRRSELMHGRLSPKSTVILNALRLAHRAVPRALFGALDLFYALNQHGQNKPDDLERGYVNLEKALPRKKGTKKR